MSEQTTDAGAATIESVAELLYRLRLNNKQPWDFAPEWQRNLYRDHARAVIRWAAAHPTELAAAATTTKLADQTEAVLLTHFLSWLTKTKGYAIKKWRGSGPYYNSGESIHIRETHEQLIAAFLAAAAASAQEEGR